MASNASPTAADWSRRILRWFVEHGRHDLPWQHPRTPYRVWVSEIMLQQTTVQAVIPYFERFLDRFPDVSALACAPLDDVLAHWSGLGYYARARNLHSAAQRIVERHGGELPADQAALEALPGVGRSTAAAIRAQAFAQPAAILDGNVKRLLARHAGVEGWPGQPAVQARLWRESEARLPLDNAVDYTQAMMDLGGSVCRRRQPLCDACPVADDCQARTQGLTGEIPASRPRKERPQRAVQFLIERRPEGEVRMVRRPPAGIWGGLWSFPERDPAQGALDELRVLQRLPDIDHAFSHFDLRITPCLVDAGDARAEDADDRWFHPRDARNLGVPKPVLTLLEQLDA